MPDLLLIVFAVAGLLALLLLLLIGQHLNLYIMARLSNAPVTIFEILGMRLRGVDVREVAFSRIRLVKAGIDIPTAQLETHSLAGGRVRNVVSALIAARKARIDLDWDRATAIDLAGRDILDAVQTAINPIVVDCPGPGQEMLSAAARDGLPLLVRARIVLRTNMARLVGGGTAEMMIACIADALVATIDSCDTCEQVVANREWIAESLMAQGLDAGSAYHIDAIEVHVRRDHRARPNRSAAADKLRPTDRDR